VVADRLNVETPLLVIVGETASGKSALALELAERFDGEIICADSRTVYRGMDIGTAKPSAEDQRRVKHFCLDLVAPDEPFTVADFKRQAQAAIADISARGKLPILVGGTGLYVDAILYDYTFRAPADKSIRSEHTALSVGELQNRLNERGIALPNNPHNPRHLIRALETDGVEPTRQPLRPNTLIIGLTVEREVLKERIVARVSQMIESGLTEEAEKLGQTYGWDTPPMQTIGYEEWKEYFLGTATLVVTKELIVKNTLAYAKRQRTWFKRNKSIHWYYNRGEIANIVELTTTPLNK
jgi:tRNA dimethylallyltransferase